MRAGDGRRRAFEWERAGGRAGWIEGGREESGRERRAGLVGSGVGWEWGWLGVGGAVRVLCVVWVG